jgi:hypothetical protein
MSLAIWQGFDHYWQREPHRLNRIGSWIEMDRAAKADRVACTYYSEMQIGRFPPDVCHTHAMIHRAGSASTRHIDGEVSVVLRGRLGERVEVDGEVASHGLPEGDLTATVVMRGFRLESGFPHGFQTRGFGFRLSNIQQHTDGDVGLITFAPRYFIYPDRSPDPTTNPNHIFWRILPFPQALGPHTPDEFEYTMTLLYSIVLDRVEQARFTLHDINYGPLKSRYVGPGAGRKSVHHTLDGGPGEVYRSASVGIRGFKWELLHWPRTRLDGRYLRKVECMLDGLDYDPMNGKVTVNAKMEFNNFGGRQGREQVRKWIAFLRAHRKRDRERLRAIARSLRMSYGFMAQYDLSVTLLQFKDSTTFPVSHVYNVVRRDMPQKQHVQL